EGSEKIGGSVRSRHHPSPHLDPRLTLRGSMPRALAIAALSVVLAAGDCGTSSSTGNPCVPTTCAEAARTCGEFPDSCGGVLECGTCAAGQECTPFGACEKPCVKKTCADVSVQCGPTSDGCYDVIECGGCDGTQICGVTTDNVCAEPPDPCVAGAWNAYA